MNKTILVLFYSQSGQLSEIVSSFISPFKDSGIEVESHRIKPTPDFPFPWTSPTFFDAMPESVMGKPVELEPFTITKEKYDLIVFAYQPWFLSPSIPATSILLHPSVQVLLKNTPVITLIGARNMWLNAQEKVKTILQDSGAKHVGNIALIDKNQNHISAVTILYWMLSGKKEKYLGFFPKPGVSSKDINNASFFGKTVLPRLLSENWEGMQEELVASKAVEVKADLMFIEARAGRLFSVWAQLVAGSKKNRPAWVTGFKYYLLVALFIVAPIVLVINNLLFKPFFQNQINKKKRYYLGLN